MPLQPNGNNGYTETQPTKSYLAAISQPISAATSGLLITGHKYIIHDLITGDDFTNVGYTAEDVQFTASGTTPTNWTHSTLVIDITLSPLIITELQNTIGTITWTRDAAGDYTGQKTDAFPANKTYINGMSTWDSDNIAAIPVWDTNGNPIAGLISLYPQPPNNIKILCADKDGNYVDFYILMGDSKLYLPIIQIFD